MLYFLKSHHRWILFLVLVAVVTSIPHLRKMLALTGNDYDRPSQDAFVTLLEHLKGKPYISPTQKRDSSSGRVIGVVGAWTLGASPKTTNEASTLRLDSLFCVRFRDLDGWIIRLLADRVIVGKEVLYSDELKEDPEILCRYATRQLEKETSGSSKNPETGKAALPSIRLPQESSDDWGVIMWRAKSTSQTNPKAPKGPTDEELQKKLNRLLRIFQDELYPVIDGVHFRELGVINPGQSGIYWKKEQEGGNRTTVSKDFPDEDRSDDLIFALRRGSDGTTQQNLFARLHREVGLFNRVNLTLAINMEELRVPLLAVSLLRPDGPAPSQAPRIIFVPWAKITWTILIVVTTIGFLVWVGKNTDMLRSNRLRRRPTGTLQYSLSHCQFAFWTAVIVVSFAYLMMVLGDIPKFSDSAFFLMGIALATAFGTSLGIGETEKEVIQAYNRTMALREGSNAVELKAKLQSMSDGATLAWQNAMREQMVKPSQLTETVLENLYQNHLEFQRQLRFLKTDSSFYRWLVDLLSENGDVTLPRVQMFLWTLVLGFAFLWQTFTKLEMPDFPATVLGLMGLSAGGFVGFRIQEVERAGRSLKPMPDTEAHSPESPPATLRTNSPTV